MERAMKRNIGLLVLTLIIAAAALFLDIRFDRQSTDARTRVLVVEREHAALSAGLAELRAAQASYLAAGQGPDFWMSKATDLAAQVGTSLASLREQAVSPEARQKYHAAEAALADFNKFDGRARDFVRSDQRLFASDLVFMDSLQAIEKIGAELSAARSMQTAAAETDVIQVSRLRLAVNAASLAGLALIAFLVRPQGAAAPAAAEQKAPASVAPSTLQMLRDLPPPVRSSPPPAPPPIAPPLPVAQPAPRGANLSAAAELCVDLARVADASEMPTLVQRAATVLEAKGVVLWVADAAGTSLRPTLTHGYADKVLARMGPLQVDSENVTALAFRSMQAHAVSGTSPADPGAVAVPLITPSGCVGVLAAETRPNRNGQDLLPLARIIAAQFSSIVAPTETGVLPAQSPPIEARTAQA
jgi:hypothetical protein